MPESPREVANRIERCVAVLRQSPYVPVEPTDLQWAFLCDERPEVLFAGGVGGGKTVAMLAAALMYAHIPGYNAVVFRRTFPDLMQPSGLIPLANKWLINTDAHKLDGGKKWLFPSGATLSFYHMENPQDAEKHAGLEAHFLGWDEIAQMPFEPYELLQSRMRRGLTTNPELADVPMRTRATANPGHKYAKWVKEYWISDENGVNVSQPDRLYIHSTLRDNPHLDQEDYNARLEKLDPVKRAQMIRGDWLVTSAGNMFKEDDFRLVDGKTPGECHYVRAWDLAGSAKKKSDYCAGVLMARSKETGLYRIEHLVHGKFEPGPLEQIMRQTAELDGRDVPVLIEEERAGSGKIVLSHMRRTVLKGYRVHATRPEGDKVVRAGLFSALVDRGEMELTRAGWNDKLIQECVSFDAGLHDDMVDAAAQACHFLSRLPVRNQSGRTVPDSSQGQRLDEANGSLPAPHRVTDPSEAGLTRKQVDFLVSKAPGRRASRGIVDRTIRSRDGGRSPWR